MISNIPVQLKMHYYCDVRDKTTKLKSEKIQRKSLTHIQYEKS